MKKIKFSLVSMLVMASAFINSVAAGTITIPASGSAELNPNEAEIVKAEANSRARLKGEPAHFDFFGYGDKAVFSVNNTTAQEYTISFEASTMHNDASVQLIITDANGKDELSQTITLTEGSWNAFKPYSVKTSPLSKGEKKLTIVFLNGRGKGTTANVKNVKFTK